MPLTARWRTWCWPIKWIASSTALHRQTLHSKEEERCKLNWCKNNNDAPTLVIARELNWLDLTLILKMEFEIRFTQLIRETVKSWISQLQLPQSCNWWGLKGSWQGRPSEMENFLTMLFPLTWIPWNSQQGFLGQGPKLVNSKGWEILKSSHDHDHDHDHKESSKFRAVAMFHILLQTVLSFELETILNILPKAKAESNIDGMTSQSFCCGNWKRKRRYFSMSPWSMQMMMICSYELWWLAGKGNWPSWLLFGCYRRSQQTVAGLPPANVVAILPVLTYNCSWSVSAFSQVAQLTFWRLGWATWWDRCLKGQNVANFSFWGQAGSRMLWHYYYFNLDWGPIKHAKPGLLKPLCLIVSEVYVCEKKNFCI